MNIDQIMSTRVVSVEPDDALTKVKEIFEKLKFHHVLVVEGGQLVGIVSDRDLLKAISPNLGTLAENSKDIATLNKKVHQIMTRHPFVLNSGASVEDAIDLINAHGISCVPIVDGRNRAVGIVSWRDLLKNLGRR